MFFKKLYGYNKSFCLAVVVFLMAYFYLNYKWGLIATPIQQYGMFSGKQFLKDTFTVYTVIANGKSINETEISQIERDAIQSYPEYYKKQEVNNEVVFHTLKKYFEYAGISMENQRYKYRNAINDSQFKYWFKSRIEKIPNEPMLNPVVYRQKLIWENNSLKAIDTPIKFSFIAAE